MKYRAAIRGVISVPFKTCWADRNGIHMVPIDKSSIDLLCVYGPDTDRCYYLDPRGYGGTVQLRLDPPRNAQKQVVDIPPSVLGIPAGPC